MVPTQTAISRKRLISAVVLVATCLASPFSERGRGNVEAAAPVGQRAGAALFVVTSDQDPVDGAVAEGLTLRAAIASANSTPDLDTIVFDFSEPGTHTIRLSSALPPITQPVAIDGYLLSGQPPLAPSVAIDGSQLTSPGPADAPSGLVVSGGSTLIRGLDIEDFPGHGIVLVGSGRNSVESCSIGVDLNGLPAGNGGDGVVIASSGNSIGGFSDTTPFRRNVIAANGSHGIEIVGGNHNRIECNVIGGEEQGLPNGGCGVLIARGSANSVGGPSKGLGNRISRNGADAVRIRSGSANSILGNITLAGRGLGIDIGPMGPNPNDAMDVDRGANNLQNAPQLERIEMRPFGIRVDGCLSSVPNTVFRVELFEADRDYTARRFIGVVVVATDVNGTADFHIDILLTAALAITATATGPDGSTSELSRMTRISR